MKLPLKDKHGKEFGFLLISDEAWEILKTTGVKMTMQLDATNTEVVGYLS